MTNQVFIELFRFNHKTDYLPYYKKYKLSYEQSETIDDLLNKIDDIEKFSFNKEGNFDLKVNNYYLKSSELVSDVVAKTCDTLVIEPVSIYRAINDLTINNDDFMEKLSQFDAFLTQEQKEQYIQENQLEYYASNTLNFNKSYIGEHALLVASDIIEANPESKDEVLEIITKDDSGVLYHTSIANRVFKQNENYNTKVNSLLESLSLKTSKASSEDAVCENISQKFTDFNIACYSTSCNQDIKSLVEDADATFVSTLTNKDDLGLQAPKGDKLFTNKVAGTILLDAKDNNADFIVVRDESDMALFEASQKDLEKAVGREIELPVVSLKQFKMLTTGIKDKKTLGFDKHTVNVSFL